VNFAWLVLALTAACAEAQTTVILFGGTTNTAPIYTGSLILDDSPISVSNRCAGHGATTYAVNREMDGNGNQINGDDVAMTSTLASSNSCIRLRRG